VFLFVSTYALSSTVFPVAQRAGCPIVVLNIQPASRIDYASFNAIADRGVMTGEWLAHCQACAVPEIASVFKRGGIDYHLVTGYLQEEAMWARIGEWVQAAAVARVMRTNRLGVLGHYYDGMLDVYTDVTRQLATFGGSVDLIEMCEVRDIRDHVTDAQTRAKRAEFDRAFDVSPECDPTELDRAARTSVALDTLASRRGLGSLAYYYEGVRGNEYEDIATSVIAGNSLLTASGVPVAGECEIKNAQAMKIMDSFGAGGSFSEFYALDFDDDVVLLGHDGPAHFAISQGRVGLVPLPVYHGKPGKGLSIQMTVRHGPSRSFPSARDLRACTFSARRGNRCRAWCSTSETRTAATVFPSALGTLSKDGPRRGRLTTARSGRPHLGQDRKTICSPADSLHPGVLVLGSGPATAVATSVDVM